MIKEKELSKITTISELLCYLEVKGMNHSNYYHYTTWNSLVKILTNKSFLLTRGNSLAINDQHEALMKGSWQEWNRIYIGSFAHGSPENMAMWGLYGIPWEDAVRITIPKKAMLRWVNSIDEVYPWNNGMIDNNGLKAEVHLADIIYVEGVRGTTTKTLKHRTGTISTKFVSELNNADMCPEMTGYIKNIAWSYENEVRLHIKLPFTGVGEKIMINIPDDVVETMTFTTGPNFEWKNDLLFRSLKAQGRIATSAFEHLVNYRSLCQVCAHRNFERRV